MVVPQARRASAAPSDTSDGWETYRSGRGDFSVDHPVTWTVAERVDARGVLVTMLTPPSGRGVSVEIRSGTSIKEDDSDLMSTRCKEVTVGGRPARTCLDTISFSLCTTVVDQGKTYIIMSTRKRGDQRIYDRVLASLRIFRYGVPWLTSLPRVAR